MSPAPKKKAPKRAASVSKKTSSKRSVKKKPAKKVSPKKKNPAKKKQASKKKMKVITVKGSSRFWKSIAIFLVLSVIAVASAAVLYQLNPTFRSNVNGFNKLFSRIHKQTMASALDISKIIFHSPTPTPEMRMVTIIDCPDCGEINIDNYISDRDSVKIRNIKMGSNDFADFSEKVVSVPAIIDGDRTIYPPAVKIVKRPETEFFKGNIDDEKNEIFAYMAFDDEKSKELAPLLDELIKKNDNIRLYYKYYIRTSTDYLMATAAHCGGKQGKFWPIHNALYEEGPTNRNDVSNLISSFEELDGETFNRCMDDPMTDETVRNSMEEAESFGFIESPSLIVKDEVYKGGVDRSSILSLFSEVKNDIDFENFMTWGDPLADTVFIEYSDYECPFCRQQATEVLDKLRERFGDDIFYIRKDFPISAIHPQAIRAAVAARCAGKQGQYWPMHDLLFEYQGHWHAADNPAKMFLNFAVDLELDEEKFSSCLSDDIVEAQVIADFDDGRDAGIVATPTSLIIRNGETTKIEGILSFKDFERILDEK